MNISPRKFFYLGAYNARKLTVYLRPIDMADPVNRSRRYFHTIFRSQDCHVTMKYLVAGSLLKSYKSSIVNSPKCLLDHFASLSKFARGLAVT